jgi:hypothetical protein
MQDNTISSKYYFQIKKEMEKESEKEKDQKEFPFVDETPETKALQFED